MVTKPKRQKTGSKKGRAKIRKLKINKETVKDLSESDVKNIKGGLIPESSNCVKPGIYDSQVKNIKGGVIPILGVQ